MLLKYTNCWNCALLVQIPCLFESVVQYRRQWTLWIISSNAARKKVYRFQFKSNWIEISTIINFTICEYLNQNQLHEKYNVIECWQLYTFSFRDATEISCFTLFISNDFKLRSVRIEIKIRCILNNAKVFGTCTCTLHNSLNINRTSFQIKSIDDKLYSYLPKFTTSIVTFIERCSFNWFEVNEYTWTDRHAVSCECTRTVPMTQCDLVICFSRKNEQYLRSTHIGL